jgi:hydroxymethylbilane synthase
LRKLEAGDFDATILAVAGLNRLGLLTAATSFLDAEDFVPAVGQGAIGIETREDDDRTRALVAAIDDADTATALAAERAFLAVLDGSCRTPIGGHARVAGAQIRFRGLLAKTDGSEVLNVTREGRAAEAAKLGAEAAHDLKARAGSGFFVEA